MQPIDPDFLVLIERQFHAVLAEQHRLDLLLRAIAESAGHAKGSYSGVEYDPQTQTIIVHEHKNAGEEEVAQAQEDSQGKHTG